MKVQRAVLVDDEELARQILKEYLAPHPDVEVVAECTNGFEAVRAMAELNPDVVFLDIQMPKLNGFEVLELADWNGAVVFVTAYDQYAIRAFEVHAVDYLLKPFSRERFEEALNVVRQRHWSASPISEIVSAAHASSRRIDRVLVREGVHVHVIPVHKIDFIEAQDDYISIHAEGRSYLKHQRLTAVEHALDPSRFIRIHRSFLLNIDRLAKIELYAKDSRTAILKDGRQLPVSRRGYDVLKRLL